jgi:hypothetical protein
MEPRRETTEIHGGTDEERRGRVADLLRQLRVAVEREAAGSVELELGLYARSTTLQVYDREGRYLGQIHWGWSAPPS